ncbi:hydroxymethylpyrimidine kinase/phosphomethylpyrimidine kinase/thiamine-phosphate diphosphorylase [Halalkaliarchaeum desulfuricum]|uniref:Hydroxymethylpyrimidine kinase/phosphomethylpyrimidine kinase/thiamine-phosphate diphosphorylase n=1 Tax=Halalkaliarchaeum desulfuricum TaxID=2055893 RepID=A0A343TMI9_9EURY|nr:bifunctional hydroxymethylpyrimidine kinase/phosphomethylpyrimidine kinase [Halalkaliarchaeum desulfuricum]AUX10311.1 hydroxymethylpyrimidine kinase/phosphomethylpyrimidine kinase/thiamine-phosphate diphosphorylase [Halalkaliarchaeum desulfuricum]
METQRRAATVRKPVVLTIAGSDSGGGAGIQADLKTMEALGTFGTSVVTSVTAQNTVGVESTHPVPVPEIEAQIDAVLSDFDVRAVKTGMLGTRAVVEAITERATDMSIPLVVDPVMVAASGDRLLEPAAEAAYEELIAESTLVTPNADEAAVLTGMEPEGEETAREAGERLVELGAEAALVKGGHVPGDRIRDVLVFAGGEETRVFDHPRVDTDATHGSGCTLSSAIAARLARGAALEDAVRDGISLLERAVRYPLDVGSGPGPVHHLVGIRERASRHPTAEAVEGIVDSLVEMDARPLVPEVGTNVVGATPFAEAPAETAAVEGRIARTRSGVRPNRGVRFGASSHVARFLLSAREHDPDLRFAANLRFDDGVESALSALEGAVEIDRSTEPAPDVEGSTMGWAAGRAFDRADGTPTAVFDRGDVGKEAMTRLLASDPETLVGQLRTVLEELDNGGANS